ncbi:MAG: Xaa-Pro peptidase family protein [Gammaproteobacteria bacterium]|nr:Xaa-Pro peptidase family protein [Gammaproteobacteria bacterium]
MNDASEKPAVVRQHGAMEFSAAPVDLDVVRRYRIGRVRAELRKRDYAGIVLFDQLNTRYATDVTNMQVWCSHNENRYVFVATEGPAIVFEYGAKAHLAEGISTVDEVRPARPWYYFVSGNRYREQAQRWAAEIDDLVRQHGGGNRRLAIDRTGYDGIAALLSRGIELFDGFEVMEHARVIKSPEEIVLMQCAIDACQRGMDAMRDALRPGITENALLSKLHETNVALGGEWIECRLLTSGPRTNPWFREASMRPIEKGDLVSFDTDLVGPYGYCADISRSWICGEDRPSDEQRRLYSLAVEQIEHNKGLIRPGVGLREISEKAWPIPEEFLPNRYGCILHGVGLCDEYPDAYHLVDFEDAGYDEVIREGMTLCVESYMGAAGGREGVKLEDQFLVTADGLEPLSTYPLELDWL